MSNHLAIEVVELCTERLDHGPDARAHHRDGQVQLLALGEQHGQQLAPARVAYRGLRDEKTIEFRQAVATDRT